MNRTALLSLPIAVVFLCFLGTEDGFSRGGGMRGGLGGSYHGSAGASYRGGGGSYRSPSMSSHSGQRSSASQSRPRQSSNVASRPSRPSSQKPTVSQRPASSGQKMSSTGSGQRPAQRPSAGGVAGKPSRGDVQQFLNMPQQGGTGLSSAAKVGAGVAAGALGYAGASRLLEGQGPGAGDRVQAGTLPAERPGTGGREGIAQLPGAGDRVQAGTLPAERPGTGGREGIGQRPGPGDGVRPGTLPADRPGGDRRPGEAVRPGMGDRPSQLPARANADRIRNNLENRYDNVFSPDWWRDHPNASKAYWQNFGKYQYARNHWWRPAAWGAVGAWVAGSSWSSPTYYDYGEGIYYENDQVYSGGTPVASAEEYYQQASSLASSAPQTPEPEAEWLPLGVFAVSRENASDSNVLLQLAVDKNGVIAGTYYNTTTDTTRPIKGMVDKKTQRAAWTFGDGKNTDVIMETGLFNLTQDQTEVLVHFGKNKTQQWLLVRLKQPNEKEKPQQGKN